MTRSGTRIYSEGRPAVVYGADGAVLGALLGLRDVTAQREAEELQATFLSVISHELQTPLAVIRGYAELLADAAGQIKPGELRQKLGIVAEESAKLSKMVTNLLDASRIQAGGLELKPEPIDLRRLVERVVQKMAPLSSKHRFEVAMSHELPPVLAAKERVEQVLTNLLETALKYSPGGGTILITGDLTSDEVIIHVSDEGIGVPEADRQRIFSRFHRLKSRQVRQMKGVGLGLYIARAIVGAHGGRIWVDAAPGGGAQFSFSLPRQHKAPLPILFGRG
jgi:signal transduction histidine kinase